MERRVGRRAATDDEKREFADIFESDSDESDDETRCEIGAAWTRAYRSDFLSRRWMCAAANCSSMMRTYQLFFFFLHCC